jgi:hypothetical protein
MSEVIELLKSGRAKLAKGHVQGTYAWPAHRATDPDATRWCMLGSVGLDNPKLDGQEPMSAAEREVVQILTLLVEGLGVTDICDFNNSHTQDECIAVFDRAIAETVCAPRRRRHRQGPAQTPIDIKSEETPNALV